MPQCIACGDVFPNLIRVNGKKRNLCNRKKCPKCKPFRHGEVTYLTARTFYEACVLCDKPGSHRLCRACRTKIRRHRAKTAAVKLLGGKCQRCGWDKNISGLQFHHLGGKEFTIGSSAHKSWAVIRKEVEKCILLCANCHCIEHSDREDPAFLNEVASYHGGEFYGT